MNCTVFSGNHKPLLTFICIYLSKWCRHSCCGSGEKLNVFTHTLNTWCNPWPVTYIKCTCQDSPETPAATVKGVEGREGAEVDSVNSRGWISFWFPATGDLDVGKWGSWGTCQQTRGTAEQGFKPLFWKRETETHDRYGSHHVDKSVTKGHSFLKLPDI